MKHASIKSFISICILAVSFCSYSRAQIVYTDINPDQTFSTTGSVYHLDLNNDGINDFNIVYDTFIDVLSSPCNEKEQGHSIAIAPLKTNAEGFTTLGLAPLNPNTVVDSAGYTWYNSPQNLESFYWECVYSVLFGYMPASFVTGSWTDPSDTDKYIALRLHANSKTYYGWIRIGIKMNGYFDWSFTVKEYAFNSKAGLPILTGQKSAFNWAAVTALSPSWPYCPGQDRVAYEKGGSFQASNVFTAQLSDSVGSFAKPVVIGSIHSNISETIPSIIPANTSPGGRYRIRVVSSDASDSSYDNGNDIVIGAGIYASGPTEFCRTGNANLILAAATGYSYQWLVNGKKIKGDTDSFIQVDSSGKYKCIVNGICGRDTSNTITVVAHALPLALAIAEGPTTFCDGASVTLIDTATITGPRYQWYKVYGSDILDTISGATSSSYTATETGDYFPLVTDTYGCANNGATDAIVNVLVSPESQIFILGNDTSFCTGDSLQLQVQIGTNSGNDIQYQWSKNGADVPGAALSYYYAKTDGVYSCKMTNACGSNISDSVTLTMKECDLGVGNMANAKTLKLKIAPNPLSNATTISYTLNSPEKIYLSIYDVSGRLIKILSENTTQAGDQTIIWMATNVTAGIYFLQIHSADFSQTEKLIVAR